jgi:D-alanine-D-alanine ligase-like ATP-grasp enzyme
MPQFQRKSGYFDLLGFDFMITAGPENKLMLIEINTNPSLAVGEIFI